MEQGQFFADTFCGVARVGRSAARRGFKTRFYDILIDPVYGDMTNPKVKSFLKGAAKDGSCIAMMLQPLCASWSVALVIEPMLFVHQRTRGAYHGGYGRSHGVIMIIAPLQQGMRQ